MTANSAQGGSIGKARLEPRVPRFHCPARKRLTRGRDKRCPPDLDFVPCYSEQWTDIEGNYLDFKRSRAGKIKGEEV